MCFLIIRGELHLFPFWVLPWKLDTVTASLWTNRKFQRKTEEKEFKRQLPR